MRQQTTILDSLRHADSANPNKYDSLHPNPFSFLDSTQATPQQDWTSQTETWGLLIGGAIVVMLLVIAVRRDLRERKARLRARHAGHLADRVRAWHAGQLATAWVGVLLTDIVLRALFYYNVEGGYDDNTFAAGLCVVIGFGLTAAMLWASWTWFGSRNLKG